MVDTKPRPALVVCELPAAIPTVLICGISSRLELIQPAWDILLEAVSPGFQDTGLAVSSVIRPSWLATFPRSAEFQALGRVSPQTLVEVRRRIANAIESPLGNG